MSKRHAREHGRILSVDEETLGSVLVADAASGATTLTVDDAAEFEDDGTGGWLSVNDQVIQYDTVDDDAGTIHLKTGLTAAADDGDPVYVWSKLYDTAATVKTALVMVDGEDENTDPIHATLADAVQDLPEGLRGEAGESCTLVRVSDDEWEITAVGGQPSSAKGSKGVRFEANDVYVLTAEDIAATTAVMTLSHRPSDEGIVAFWGVLPQEPTEYTVDYGARTVTWSLSGFEQPGQRIWVHYAYVVGVATPLVIEWESTWPYLLIPSSDIVNRSSVDFNDSGWAKGQGGFGAPAQPHPLAGWPPPNTVWNTPANNIWVRRRFSRAEAGSGLAVSIRNDAVLSVYWNGSLIKSSTPSNYDSFTVSIDRSQIADRNVLAIKGSDANQPTYLDISVASL